MVLSVPNQTVEMQFPSTHENVDACVPADARKLLRDQIVMKTAFPWSQITCQQLRLDDF